MAEEERSEEENKITVPDYFHICTNCGGRNTKFLEEEIYECYDCGETYSVSEKDRKDFEIMKTYEILNWIQNNKAIIHIEQGPEAFKEICENGGSEALEECNIEKEGEDGYWVEVALNEDCAGWSYKRSLVDAIKDAFYAMIGYALEIGYVRFYPLGIPVLLPLKEIPENLRGAKSWIGFSRFNFETHKIEYNEINYNKENG